MISLQVNIETDLSLTTDNVSDEEQLVLSILRGGWLTEQMVEFVRP